MKIAKFSESDFINAVHIYKKKNIITYMYINRTINHIIHQKYIRNAACTVIIDDMKRLHYVLKRITAVLTEFLKWNNPAPIYGTFHYHF